VTDVNVKVDGNANPSKMNGGANLGLDMPLFAIPDLFRGLAQQGADRAKENCHKIKAASGEMADVLRESYSAHAKGAAEYGAKVIDISRENTGSALEFMAELMATKSISEAFSLSAAQSRKSLEFASAQNGELWKLAQMVATEAAEPIKKSFARVLQGGL
jgi:phasin